jgi:hypothetical protein
MPHVLTPGELLEQKFLENAPPRFQDIYMKVDVDFHNPGQEYTVTIKLYDSETDEPIQWREPAPKVRVTYYADGESKQSVMDVILNFDGNKNVGSFTGDLKNWKWEDYLLIGMEFGGLTVNYTFRSINSETQTEFVDALRVDEMRKVSLLSYKTCAEGDNQIWGKGYSGSGEILAIRSGHAFQG